MCAGSQMAPSATRTTSPGGHRGCCCICVADDGGDRCVRDEPAEDLGVFFLEFTSTLQG